MISIQPATLRFLKELSTNNDRDWFAANKARYTSAHENMCAFVDALIVGMNKHDKIENESGKKSIYRIYSDVRFKKDKSPYNPRFAFSLQRATKFLRGGYYMRIQPGECFLACGFFAPNPQDLKRIREDIDLNYTNWKKLLKNKSIVEYFGGKLSGETVATAPKGFPRDHDAIELLRHKQFILKHTFSDKEVIAEDFLHTANRMYKGVRPFFDYMSEVLTTDANGESLVK